MCTGVVNCLSYDSCLSQLELKTKPSFSLCPNPDTSKTGFGQVKIMKGSVQINRKIF